MAASLGVLLPFSVVVVPFPFVDRGVARRRPALVVSSERFNTAHPAVVMAMITTARASTWANDVVLEDWQAAGLTAPCRVRLKLFTLDVALLLGQRGSLSAADRQRVATAMRAVLAFD